MRDAGDMEDRIVIGQRIEAGVVAEWPFGAHLAQLDVALEHDLRVRGHLQIDGFALHQLDRRLAKKTGDDVLLNLGWRGHDGGECRRRVGADSDRNLHALAAQIGCGHGRHAGDRSRRARAAASCGRHDIDAGSRRASRCICSRRHAQPLAEVLGRHLLPLPVHPSGLAVVDLHAVHAHISLAVAVAPAWISGDDQRQCDEAATVHGPALQYGKVEHAEAIAPDDLLTQRLACRHDFGEVLPYLGQYGQHLQLAQHAFGRLHLHERLDAACDLVQTRCLKRHLHAAAAAELVHQHARAGIALDALEEQRRPTGRVACHAGFTA